MKAGERLGGGLRLCAGGHLDVGVGSGQETVTGDLCVSGPEYEDAEGRGAHEPGISVWLGGPQWLMAAVARISVLETSQVWVGSVLRCWTKPKRLAE